METSTTDMAVKEQVLSLEEDEKNELIDICQTGELQALIKLRKSKPKVSQKISADILPTSEPVLDYIQELEWRHRIFEEIHRFVVGYSYPSNLTMATFGIVMVAPIPYLEAYLGNLQNHARVSDEATVTALLSSFLFQSEGICAFANRGGRQPSVPNSPQSSPAANTPRPGRNKSASKLCKLRDNNECIFTGTPHPEAAHIFPYGALKHRYIARFKTLLTTFWGQHQSRIWWNLIQDGNVTESPQNLISLNHQIHWWFDNGNMALKPLRTLHDGSVIVQFHWLKRHYIESTTEYKGDIDNYMRKAGLEDNSAWGEILAHRKSGLPLKTGQIFTLKANSPDLVPSFELLKLSWDMLRILAISGAAEPEELSDEDDCGNREAGSNAWYDEVSSRLQSWIDQTEKDDEHEHVDSRG